MADVLTYTGKLVVEECCACFIKFAMPADLMAQLRNNTRAYFHCPLGHSQHYTMNETAELRRKLKDAQRRADQAERQARDAETSRKAAVDQAQAAEYRRRAAKGQLTRTRNRIAAGVCPCCRRSFRNLADHMTTKHPDYPADGEQ